MLREGERHLYGFRRLGRKATGLKAVEAAILPARSNTGLDAGQGQGTRGEGTGWGAFRKGFCGHSDMSFDREGGILRDT